MEVDLSSSSNSTTQQNQIELPWITQLNQDETPQQNHLLVQSANHQPSMTILQQNQPSSDFDLSSVLDFGDLGEVEEVVEAEGWKNRVTGFRDQLCLRPKICCFSQNLAIS